MTQIRFLDDQNLNMNVCKNHKRATRVIFVSGQTSRHLGSLLCARLVSTTRNVLPFAPAVVWRQFHKEIL